METNQTPEQEAQATTVAGKVGRNDPCPCGSGKKFKKCCVDSPAYTAAPVQPQAAAKPASAQAAAAPHQPFAKQAQARGGHAIPASRNTFIRRKV